MRGMVLEKRTKFLGLIEDKDITVSFTTTVSGTTTVTTGDGASKVNKISAFAKAIDEPVAQYGSGQIYFAQEQNILNQLALTDAANKNVYNEVDLDVAVVKTKGKSTAAKILGGAVGAMSDLSFPANPYSTIYDAANKYVTSIFKPLIADAVSEKEAVNHHIVMTIDAAGCSSDDEHTGTMALVDEPYDESDDGSITLAEIDDQSICWKSVLTPSFSIQFARVPAGGKCQTVAAASYKPLRNSFIGFVVNAAPASVPKSTLDSLVAKSIRSAEPVSSGRVRNLLGAKANLSNRGIALLQEAIARCRANELPADKCV